jgi:hypothetical protein
MKMNVGRSIAGTMRNLVQKYLVDDDRDMYEFLDSIGRAFRHCPTSMIVKFGERYLREAGDIDSADALAAVVIEGVE